MKLPEAIKTKKKFDNEEGVALNIMYTSYYVKSTANAVLKEYALSSEQYNILRILKGAHPNKVNVKQISERLIERNANVPRTIDKLVLKKLVKRSDSAADKRETVSEISSAGIKLLEAVNPVMEKTLKNLSGLTKSELAQLNKLLDKYRKTDL